MMFRVPGLMITTSALLIAVLSLSSSLAIGADNYPSRPIKLMVGASPGGTTDTMARAIALPLALCGGYALETVEECVIETQTGYQNRRPEQHIDRDALLAGFKAVHKISDADRAAALVRDGEIAMLDEGEKALWAHAIARSDAWLLCGPDKASLRIGGDQVCGTVSLRLSAFLKTSGFARRRHSGAPIAKIG
jgi:hypothetical protein